MPVPPNKWERALAHPPDARSWRGLDELLGDPESLKRLVNEFPDGATDAHGFSRRKFLALLGASAGLAGAACTTPTTELLLPYSKTPVDNTPGQRLHFATSTTLDGFAMPILATSLDGRPIKLDGHPDHPATIGTSDAFTQAAILDLYDPQRTKSVQYMRGPSTWGAFEDAFLPKPGSETRLALLLEPTSSALTQALLTQVQTSIPNARRFYYTPFASRAPAGIKLATGQWLQPTYDLSKAQVIVTLDADLLGVGPQMSVHARGFAEARRVTGPTSTMSRLYAIEPTLTVTGMSADHRIRVSPARMHHVALQLTQALSEMTPELPPELVEAKQGLSTSAPIELWIRSLARDLWAHRGAALVAVGDAQPAEVHALAYLSNLLLGSVGQTITFTKSPLADQGDPGHGLKDLVDAIESKSIDKIIILNGNPAYSDRAFADALPHVPHSAYFGLFETETSERCQWTLPSTHFLETWSDARTPDGTITFTQPLIEPLYAGRSLNDVLAKLGGESPTQPTAQRMREFWTPRLPDGMSWESAIQRGMLPGSALPAVVPEKAWAGNSNLFAVQPPAPSGGLELDLRPDSSVYDGRYSNNAWLQEMPDPVTKLTWSNAALISPLLAARFGLDTGHMVSLKRDGRELRTPVYVLPGQDDEVVTLSAGYGRAAPVLRGEPVADVLGTNAFLLGAGSVTLTPLDRSIKLAMTQEHWGTSDRPIALDRTLADYKQNPKSKTTLEPIKSLYKFAPQESPQWGMAIDLTTCTGCSACIVACQSENNIPVVGPEGVIKSREMHWIRIDRYFSGSPSSPQTVNQPMLCQHCERAPCEYVCPVNATTHSPDGINEMTYNRCVGTRFCSNNCPYKVRRFNWFDFHANETPTLALTRNDQVTVRARGVMEKCTFCIQRIRTAQITAGKQQRPLREGEVKTACQEVCPTQAITFGDITDTNSAVSKQFRLDRAYQELEELGTRPRVRYLARIRNPNPEFGS